MIQKLKRIFSENEKLTITVLTIIAYVPYFLMCYKVMPMHTTTDELGAIAGAAYLAGRDWSGVISYSGYYGFGWYALFWWLFKLTNSPFIIYRVMVAASAFLRILIIPIAYYIMRHYLEMSNDVGTYLTAVLCPFSYICTIGIANEYMLELMTWVIVLLFCKFIEHIGKGKEAVIYGSLLALASGYIALIHTRAVMLLIATVMVILAYAVLTKRVKKGIILEIGVIAVIYISAEELISAYQQWIWSASGDGLRNASVTVTTDFDIFSGKTWAIWFDLLLGNLTTQTLVTGGVFLFCIIVVAISIVNAVKKKKCNVYYVCIITISVMCMGATLLGLMVGSWFQGMYDTWELENAGTQYSYKGLVYIRYWNVYAPLFMVCGLCLAKKFFKEIKKNATFVFIIVYVALITLYLVFLVPLICNNSSATSFLFGLTGYTQGMTYDETLYFKSILLAAGIGVIFICLYISNHYKWGLLLLIVFMLYKENVVNVQYNENIRERISNMVLASYELKCELDNDGIYVENIYLNDTTGRTDSNWKIYSVAQFYFNDYTVQIELPDTLDDNDIIISTATDENIEAMYPNVNCYVLDENEVWYTYLKIEDY